MLLTRIRENDIDNLFIMRNSETIYKWCRQHDVLHYAKHKDWFIKQAKDPTISMYSIKEDISGEPIGVCGLTDIDFLHRRAEFSLYIAEHHQGKGLGKKALAALLEKGFNSYNLNIIWGETFDGNPAISMFEKLGFIREGRRRQFYYKKGKYIDAHLVSISRDEWKKSLSV